VPVRRQAEVEGYAARYQVPFRRHTPDIWIREESVSSSIFVTSKNVGIEGCAPARVTEMAAAAAANRALFVGECPNARPTANAPLKSNCLCLRLVQTVPR